MFSPKNEGKYFQINTKKIIAVEEATSFVVIIYLCAGEFALY